MARLFPHPMTSGSAMVFVDGENLAIRYGKQLKERNESPVSHVLYEPNIFVWSMGLNNVCVYGGVIRKHYYTAVQGAEPLFAEIEEKLKTAGIESPQVFKKTKERGSKRVDISLTTDMLSLACRKSYDTAVLVAGDEDYVPLVEAVKAEGRRVLLWFLENGLSPALKRATDYYADIGEILFDPELKGHWR